MFVIGAEELFGEVVLVFGGALLGVKNWKLSALDGLACGDW